MAAYEPAEDSFLLKEAVEKHAFGSVLDIGTGSGVLAIAAAKCRRVKNVTALDIDKEALSAAKKNARGKGIKFIQSDLFEKINGAFDTIIFNPPYLPQDKEFHDIALHGGKKGYETIERFLNECGSRLKKNGIVLLLFSTLTNRSKVDEIIEANCLEKELVSTKKMFFEELFVYKIEKSSLLKQLEERKISGIKLFAKGHRGVIYTGIMAGKKVAVKAERKESSAIGRMENEAKWLKILNKKGIAPKLLFSGGKFFCYEFVEGELIRTFMKHARREDIIAVLKEVFMQCRILDEMKVDKEEMHHPLKHIVVGKKIVLVDFERCHFSEKPKNVTQFCQFAARFVDMEKILLAAMGYKKDYSEKSFGRIISLLV